MTRKRLFILVEGNDDERFFKRIIVPLFLPRYDSVELIMYAGMKSEKVCRFIRSFTSMHNDLILVADIDQAPNVWVKKEILKQRFCTVDTDQIFVIIQEIESWYLAGLDDPTSKRLGLRPLHSTNHVTKEIFNKKIPGAYSSRLQFMFDILNNYSIPVAKEKNRSFRHFMTTYHLSAFVPEEMAEPADVPLPQGGRTDSDPA
jgi:hypothetical protein